MSVLRFPQLSILSFTKNSSNKLPVNRSLVAFSGKSGVSLTFPRLSLLSRPKLLNVTKASVSDDLPEEGSDFLDSPVVFVNETDRFLHIEGRNGDGVLLDLLHCLNFLGANLATGFFLVKGSGFVAKFGYYEREGVTPICHLVKKTVSEVLQKYYRPESDMFQYADYLLLNKRLPPVYSKRFLTIIHSTVSDTTMEVVIGNNPRFFTIFLGMLGRNGFQAQHESLIVSGGTAKFSLVSEAGVKVVQPNEIQKIRLIAVLAFLQVYPGIRFDLCEEEPFSGQLKLFVRFRTRVDDLGDNEDYSYFSVVALDQSDLFLCIVDELDNLPIKVDFASFLSDGLISTCHVRVSFAGSPLKIGPKKMLLSRLDSILKV